MPLLLGPLAATREQFDVLLGLVNAVADVPAKVTFEQVFDTRIAESVERKSSELVGRSGDRYRLQVASLKQLLFEESDMGSNPEVLQSRAAIREKILGDDEVAAYHRDGFLVPRYRLSAPELANLKAICGKLLDDHPDIHGVPITNPHMPYYAIQQLKTDSAPWLQWATKPELLDMTEQLVGPDIVMFQTAIFHKKAITGGRAPYHRDGKYYPIRPLAATNVWIAVTPSTIENGCVRCIPGSHKTTDAGKHHWTDGTGEELFRIELDQSEYNEADATPIVLAPGQMVFFDVMTIHGGTPNTSGMARTGFSIRYYPASSYWERVVAENHNETSSYNDFTNRPLILVRGTDRSGRNDIVTGHPAPNGGHVIP